MIKDLPLLHIGSHVISGRALLAPMAGITDLPFRQLCLEQGAAMAVSEMVTSDSTLWHSDKSHHRLRFDSNAKQDQIRSVQIAGSDPIQLADAAQKCADLGAHIIDINMGCPAKKVCKKLAGSALLRDETLVERILHHVVAAVSIPVTLKTRTGWDKDNKNGVRIAKIAEHSGISALTLHGRTRACRFYGEAEYHTLAKVVAAVNIPVIANGDITSAAKAKQVLNDTGAAAVMVGRAAFGNPWIFKQINQLLDDSVRAPQTPIPPSIADKGAMLERHVALLHEFYGDIKGVRIARKHCAWYCANLPQGTSLIRDFNQLQDAQSQIATIRTYINSISNEDLAA